MGDAIKYIGGLNIALKFGHSVDAKEFLEDKNWWNDWFKWLILGDQTNLCFERTSWLKIIGLPLKLWDETNFSSIVAKFGRVIKPFDNIQHRSDLSMGKVGILTTARRWINEEVLVTTNGETFKVGVVEYTDDWSPFKPCPFNKTEELEEEDDDDDDDISYTWMHGEDDEPEEGEIRPEIQIDVGCDLVGNEQVTGDESTPVRETEGDYVNAPEKEATLGDPPSSRIEATALESDDINYVGHITTVSKETNPDPVTPYQDGPQNNFVGPLENSTALGCFGLPLGCFGPFPSKIDQMNMDNHLPVDDEVNSAYSGSRLKRRRIHRSRLISRFSPYSRQSPNITPTIPVDDQSCNSSLDLNRNTAQATSLRSNSSVDGLSRLNKIKATAEIGAALGFQLEPNNEILV